MGLSSMFVSVNVVPFFQHVLSRFEISYIKVLRVVCCHRRCIEPPAIEHNSKLHVILFIASEFF